MTGVLEAEQLKVNSAAFLFLAAISLASSAPKKAAEAELSSSNLNFYLFTTENAALANCCLP